MFEKTVIQLFERGLDSNRFVLGTDGLEDFTGFLKQLPGEDVIALDPAQPCLGHQCLGVVISCAHAVKDAKRALDMLFGGGRSLGGEALPDQPMRDTLEMQITQVLGLVQDRAGEFSGAAIIGERKMALDEPQGGEQAKMGQTGVLKPHEDLPEL